MQVLERAVCKAQQACQLPARPAREPRWTHLSSTFELENRQSWVFPSHLYSLSLSILKREVGSSVPLPFPLANPLTINLGARAQPKQGRFACSAPASARSLIPTAPGKGSPWRRARGLQHPGSSAKPSGLGIIASQCPSGTTGSDETKFGHCLWGKIFLNVNLNLSSSCSAKSLSWSLVRRSEAAQSESHLTQSGSCFLSVISFCLGWGKRCF